MKRILSALLFVVFLAGSAFGLSDSEYLRMRRYSKKFREADDFLQESYQECKDTLPAKDFKQVKAEQIEWVKHGRDEEAGYFFDDEEEGYDPKNRADRIEVYTKVTEMRADALHHICVTYRNEHFTD